MWARQPPLPRCRSGSSGSLAHSWLRAAAAHQEWILVFWLQLHKRPHSLQRSCRSSAGPPRAVTGPPGAVWCSRPVRPLDVWCQRSCCCGGPPPSLPFICRGSAERCGLLGAAGRLPGVAASRRFPLRRKKVPAESRPAGSKQLSWGGRHSGASESFLDFLLSCVPLRLEPHVLILVK